MASDPVLSSDVGKRTSRVTHPVIVISAADISFRLRLVGCSVSLARGVSLAGREVRNSREIYRASCSLSRVIPRAVCLHLPLPRFAQSPPCEVRRPSPGQSGSPGQLPRGGPALIGGIIPRWSCFRRPPDRGMRSNGPPSKAAFIAVPTRQKDTDERAEPSYGSARASEECVMASRWQRTIHAVAVSHEAPIVIQTGRHD